MPSNPQAPPSPPRHSRHVKKGATRFEKEVAAAGGKVDEHPNDPKNIGPWRIGRTIGKGAAGRVKIARHSKTGQFAAVKILPKSTLSTAASRQSLSSSAAADIKAKKYEFGLEREIVIMKLIDHPNVMSLHDVWETDKELFLILEYVEGGELFDYLVSRGKLPASEALRYFQQIIHGVNYCHRFNICHRDLKPENLLLDSDKNIKIADFGMAALESTDSKLETSCGSPHYASPEIVSGIAYHGAASDIWSCGIILFALLVGRLPFDDENIRLLLQKVKLGKFIMPRDMSIEAKDLISRMVVVDPEKRITMSEILVHPFFNGPVHFGTGKRVAHVEPPTLDEIARPVASERDIEKDILKNLRTLWHGAPEEDIIQALLSEEKTWEKAFYTLLVKYKQKHLENLGGDNWNPPKRTASERKKSSDRESITSRKTRPASAQLHPTAPATPNSVAVRKPAPREWKPGFSEVQGRASSARTTPVLSSTPILEHPSFSPVRPAPPSPQKQASPAKGTPQRSQTSVGGPRPQSFHSPAVPAQSSTPYRTRSQRVAPSSAASSADAPPYTRKSIFSHPNTSSSNATSAASPQLPQITFHKPSPQHPTVVHGLGLGVAPTTSGSPTPGSPAAISPKVGGFVVPTVEDAALQKFLNDMASQLTALQSCTAPRSNWQHSNQASPVLEDQFADSNEGLNSPLKDARRANGREARQPLRNSQTPNIRERQPESGGKQPKALGRKSSGTMAMPGAFDASKRKSKPPPLELSAMSPHMSSFLSPRMSPGLGSTPPSPMLSPGLGFENRQSWFSNLFNWKPATATLISSSDVLVTRIECVHLLEGFGAQVSIEDVDGWGTFRCKLEKIQDLSGQILHKPVKFRVELLPHSSMLLAPNSPILDASSSGSGKQLAVTSITLVQERGALSAFKVVCARLRQEWSLCEINSPAANAQSRFDQGQGSPLPEFREGAIVW